MPTEIVTQVLGCEEDWLAPHGQKPFSMVNYTETSIRRPFLYEDNLRLGYPATHTILHSGKIFDVWGCPEK